MGRNGSIHTIVLVLVMLIGFGAALGWPWNHGRSTKNTARLPPRKKR